VPDNITRLDTRLLEALTVDFEKAVELFGGEDNIQVIQVYPHTSVRLEGSSEIGEIVGDLLGSVDEKGRFTPDRIDVSRVDWGGVGSSTHLVQFIELLTSGTGEFRALLVWEGGSVEMLSVKDGVHSFSKV